MRVPRLLEIAALVAFAVLVALPGCDAGATEVGPMLAGRWQYVQPPDPEGEVLDLIAFSGRWRGIMNGLERAGEHGLYYYVAEVENIEVAPDGAIRFEVGERTLHSRRPAISSLAAARDAGAAGVVRDRMRFTGRVEAGDLVLRCVDPGGSCPDSTLRFRRMPASPDPAARDTADFAVAIRFSVTDTTALFERPLGSDLRIRVRREHPMGWVVTATSERPGDDPPNLLYHSPSWHGPYPTDVFAWSYRSRLFPDERVLPVRGHPYEVRIRLIDCRTSSTGDDATFESGTIEVSWRRAAATRGSRE